jgi:hypothetical protein
MEFFYCRIMTVMLMVLIVCVFAGKAYAAPGVFAYIDPGTGSFILQLLIGAVCGGLFAVKLFWNKISSFLKRLLPSGRKNGNSGK